MRICQRCENKFKVTLRIQVVSWLFSRTVLRPMAALVFHSLQSPSAGLTHRARRIPMRAHVPICACASVHLKEGGRVQRGRHTTRMSEWHQEYHRKNNTIGLITQTQNWPLVSTVGARPRERCASCEGGSGCCRAAAPCTAPVKTHSRDAGGSVTLAHHSVC